MGKYISKDALVAEIRNKIDSYKGDGIISIGVLKQHCEDFISSLNTFEAKEVDLEKEIDEHWDEWAKEDGFHSVDFAKYFFDLGIKSQKGE